jgi:Restriction endonuclease
VKDSEAESKIQALDWAGLRDLWAKIQARDTPDWEPGMAFEYLVLRAFELDGALVQWPYEVDFQGVVVEQIDGLVVAAGLHAMVESKDQRERISIAPIAKLRNQLMRRPSATIGMVFSTSDYTYPAIVLASYLAGQTILLWLAREITLALEREEIVSLLEAKYLGCVKDAIPDPDTTKLEWP